MERSLAALVSWGRMRKLPIQEAQAVGAALVPDQLALWVDLPEDSRGVRREPGQVPLGAVGEGAPARSGDQEAPAGTLEEERQQTAMLLLPRRMGQLEVPPELTPSTAQQIA